MTFRVRWRAGAFALLLAPHAALAQDASTSAAAEELFREGKRLVAEGRYVDACPKLAESLRLDPGIGVRLHLASCYEKLGKTASAWAEFREAEQIASRERDRRAEVANRRAAALEGSLFRVAIEVPPTSEAPGLEVTCDGVIVGRAQWKVAVPLDPGPHTIAASAPGKIGWSSAITVPERGGTTTVTVPALADAPTPALADAPTAAASKPPSPSLAPPSSAAATTSSPARRPAAIAIAGAGVVALGVGAYFGIVAKAKLDESNQNGCTADDRCNASGAAIRDDARSAGDIATVTSLIGLAALATGGVLYFTAPASKSTTGLRVVPTGGARSAGLRVEASF